MATYTTWVPVFRQLFAESGEDFRRFYLKVGELAALDRVERQAFLVRRSDKLIGHDRLDPAQEAEPELLAPDQARLPGTGDASTGLVAARDLAAQQQPARDQVLHLRDETISPTSGPIHAREQSTGATIRTYR